jgi:hypothetical protein
MTDQLETVIEAHGDLTRWTQLETVSARLIQGWAQLTCRCWWPTATATP